MEKVIRPGLGIVLLPDHIKYRFRIEKGIVISSVGEGSAAEESWSSGNHPRSMGQSLHWRYSSQSWRSGS